MKPLPIPKLPVPFTVITHGAIRPSDPAFQGSLSWTCPQENCRAVLVEGANERYVITLIQCYRCRNWARTASLGEDLSPAEGEGA